MHLFYSRYNCDVLYKYAPSDWATKLVSRGAVRVSTLSDFRRAEVYDKERGDAGEGSRRVTSDLGRTYSNADELPPFIGQQVQIANGGQIIFDGPYGFVSEREHPDVYIYSVTEKFDRNVMRRFGGACVQITDPLGFFCAIDACLRRWSPGARSLVADGVLDRCTYQDRAQHFREESPCEDYFLKPTAYAHQSEVRAAWTPVNRNIEPLTFHVPNLAAYCRRYR